MSALTQALSAALVHFIWQGAIVGFLLWTTLHVLGHRSASARYSTSCVALSMLAILPFVTILVLYASPRALDVSTVSVLTSVRAAVDFSRSVPATTIDSSPDRIAWFAALQAWALPLWSVGVLLCSVRLVIGGTQALSLGRRGESADPSVLAIVGRLAARMGVHRPLRVLMSAGIGSPAVVGWLRPLILLPPASLLGLTPQQLEAVLAHEIAHIRRHDYLVNVVQMVVETLLFYHPVVWWTSNHIRRERELCCDDLAVRTCGDPVIYARALTILERLRTGLPSLAVGSTGGPLLYRIRRLLGPSTREYGPSRWPAVLTLVLGAGCAMLDVMWLRAQTPTPAVSGPEFAAASVKRNVSTGRAPIGGGCQGTDRDVNAGMRGLAAMAGANISFTPIPLGSCRMTGMSLKQLIGAAYGLPPGEANNIAGGPEWIDSDKYDVLAKAETPATEAELRAMLQHVLADRFKLQFHHETREGSGYALIVAKNGPRLERSTVTEGRQGIFQIAGRPMTGTNVELSELARVLSTRLNRPVVDRTGLTGRYTFALTWTPGDEDNGGLLGRLPPEVRERLLPQADPNGPSLFTALQEQLGLKLEPQKVPFEVMVLDRAERPTPD